MSEKIVERTPQEVHDNIIELLKENQQLKEELELKSGMNIAVQNLKLIEENQELKEVIDEIKKVVNNQINYREFVDIVNAIEEILEKAGDNNV